MSGRSDGYQGVVVEQLPAALFAVRLVDSNRRIVAHVEGSPRRNFVRLLPGDRVTVELTAQNRTRAGGSLVGHRPSQSVVRDTALHE